MKYFRERKIQEIIQGKIQGMIQWMIQKSDELIWDALIVRICLEMNIKIQSAYLMVILERG